MDINQDETPDSRLGLCHSATIPTLEERDYEHDPEHDIFMSNSAEEHSSIFQQHPTQKIYSPVGLSVELSEETNYDGFNFSCPLPIPMSMSSSFDFGMDRGENMNVQVFSFGREAGPAAMEDVLGHGHAWGNRTKGSDGNHNAKQVSNQSEPVQVIPEPEANKTHVNQNEKVGGRGRGRPKPKYPMFIPDKNVRREYVLAKFKNLSSQLQKAIKQTKCEGTLTSFYEGKLLDVANIQEALGTTRSILNQDQERGNMGDHPYAATMITQTASSSAIRDHQYNEEILNLGQQFEPERFEFIRGEKARDQAFCNLAKALFDEKSNLELRTGAQIKLSLKYEDIFVTEKNVSCLSNLLRHKRGSALEKVMRNIAPKTSTTSTFTTTTSRCFSLPPPPKSPAPPPGKVIIPSQVGFPTPMEFDVANVETFERSSTPRASLISYATAMFQAATGIKPISVGIPSEFSEESPVTTFKAVFQNPINSSLINPRLRDANPNSTSEPGFIDIGHRVELLNEFNNQSEVRLTSPITIADTQCEASPLPGDDTASQPCQNDSSTNTEPICSICQNVNMEDNGFWIRCNNPFCYYMVHASCVGFRVNHSDHLKLLPAFYCESHR